MLSLVGRYNYVTAPSFQLNVSTHAKPAEKQPPAITMVAPTDSYLMLGAVATLKALLSSAFGAPDGLVTFTSNGKTLGSATIQPDGSATLVTSALPAQSQALLAHYEGSANFGAADPQVIPVFCTGAHTSHFGQCCA